MNCCSCCMCQLLRIQLELNWISVEFQNFTPDFGSITREGLFSGERDKILTQVICQHLYRIGMLDIGDNLCEVIIEQL